MLNGTIVYLLVNPSTEPFFFSRKKTILNFYNMFYLAL